MSLVAERASRDEPPVLVVVVEVLHAELEEVRQMSDGRPIADWAPWVGAIAGLETYPSATIVAVGSDLGVFRAGTQRLRERFVPNIDGATRA